MNMQWDTVHEPSELEARQLLFEKYNMMLYPTLKNAQYGIKNEQKATENYQPRVQYVFSLRPGQLQFEDLFFYRCEYVKCWCAQNFPGANLGFCQCLRMALESKISWKFGNATGSAMNTENCRDAPHLGALTDGFSAGCNDATGAGGQHRDHGFSGKEAPATVDYARQGQIHCLPLVVLSLEPPAFAYPDTDAETA